MVSSKNVIAVEGLELDVCGRASFGMLTPNSAGNTTTVEIVRRAP